MKTNHAQDDRIARMSTTSVYHCYQAKVERKGKTKFELDKIITWLTGFDTQQIEALLAEDITFELFFQRAQLHPHAHLITGVICGYRIEEIENPLTKQVRYLDKLVDELANGRSMDRILRG